MENKLKMLVSEEEITEADTLRRAALGIVSAQMPFDKALICILLKGILQELRELNQNKNN